MAEKRPRYVWVMSFGGIDSNDDCAVRCCVEEREWGKDGSYSPEPVWEEELAPADAATPAGVVALMRRFQKAIAEYGAVSECLFGQSQDKQWRRARGRALNKLTKEEREALGVRE